MDEIAVLVWATIQMIAERKEPTIPAAARASTGFSFTFPITAISVREMRGSAIPAMMAGMASLLIFLKLTADSNFRNLIKEDNRILQGK